MLLYSFSTSQVQTTEAFHTKPGRDHCSLQYQAKVQAASPLIKTIFSVAGSVGVAVEVENLSDFDFLLPKVYIHRGWTDR